MRNGFIGLLLSWAAILTPMPTFGSPDDATDYIRPPHLLEKEKLPTRVTNTPLNGPMINHTTNGAINSSTSYGSDYSQNLDLNAIYTLGSEVEQSLSSDQIFTSDQRGHYLQLMTVTKDRRITLTETVPQTMLGEIIQMSFTGSCSALPGMENANSNRQCTFIPAISTDRNSIDPLLFVPTRLDQSGKYGDEFSNETLAILAQPGFQGVGANGEPVGIDWYFPNTGGQPGNSNSTTSHVSRTEEINTLPLLGYAKVRKIIKTNHAESVIGLTIHGIGTVWESDNADVNLALGAAAQLLPDVVPSLAGSDKKVSTNINLNLFNAANNTRLPDNSWTIYQAGIGHASHPSIKDGIKVMPAAYFNSLWLGLSPVREGRFSNRFHYEAISPERVILTAGGEGGQLDNVSLVSSVNGYDIRSTQLDDFYVQSYLTLLERDVNLVMTNELFYKTTYFPHLSLTGNITGSDFAVRYYGGVLASNPIKVYLGSDYTQNFWKFWSFHGGAIGYLNPDQDYFSHVQGRLSRRFSLGLEKNGTVFSSFRYAFSRQVDNFLEEPIDNYFGTGLTLGLNSWATVGTTYHIGGVLPDSIETGWGVNTGLKLSPKTQLRAYLMPSSNQKSYGLTLAYQFGKQPDSLTIQLGWQRRVYEYGSDPFDHLLESKHDVFSLNLSKFWF